MVKTGDYVIVTSDNYSALSKLYMISGHYRLEQGTIWQLKRYLGLDYNYDTLQFVADSLYDFAQQHPDIDTKCLHVRLSRFDFTGRKIEREIRQQLLEFQQQLKQKDVESSTKHKLETLMTDFQEPLFTKLSADIEAIELIRAQLLMIRHTYYLENPTDSKCTALNDTIDECRKRQDEFNDLLEIFKQKHKELELQLLDNKADQVLDDI